MENNNITQEATTTATQPIPEVIAPVVHHNTLLDRVKLPGETFKLPSGGLFYNNGELDGSVNNGEVHVHPMTAIDEIMIKTPDLLFSGKSITEVFRRCIPQVLKPNELMAKDVDFLLICLRKVTFGEFVELEYTHDCKDSKKHNYSVSMSTFLNRTKQIDPSKMSNFSVTVENGQVLKIQPIRFGSFVQIMQASSTVDNSRAEDTEYVLDQTQKIMFDSLLSAVVSVDDIIDRADVLEWLKTIPAGWIKKISKTIELSTEWGPVFTSTETCKDCGKKFELLAPLNPIAFFT